MLLQFLNQSHSPIRQLLNRSHHHPIYFPCQLLLLRLFQSRQHKEHNLHFQLLAFLLHHPPHQLPFSLGLAQVFNLSDFPLQQGLKLPILQVKLRRNPCSAFRLKNPPPSALLNKPLQLLPHLSLVRHLAPLNLEVLLQISLRHLFSGLARLLRHSSGVQRLTSLPQVT